MAPVPGRDETCSRSPTAGPTDQGPRLHWEADSGGRGYRQSFQTTPAGEGNTARLTRARRAARTGRETSRFGRMRWGSFKPFSEGDLAFLRERVIGSPGRDIRRECELCGDSTIGTELSALGLIGSCGWGWGEEEERILHGWEQGLCWGEESLLPLKGRREGGRLGVLRSVPASTEKGNVPRSSDGSEPLFNSERLLSFWSVLTSSYLNLAPQWNCWWRGCKRGRQLGREARVNLDTACCRCTGFEGLVYKRARLVAKSRQTVCDPRD